MTHSRPLSTASFASTSRPLRLRDSRALIIGIWSFLGHGDLVIGHFHLLPLASSAPITPPHHMPFNFPLLLTLIAATIILFILERMGLPTTLDLTFKGDIKRESRWF